MEKQFYGIAPVFYVKDLLGSVDFYCEVLGFERPHLWGDPPGFAMPQRDDMIVMLASQDDPNKILPKAPLWDAYFWVKDAKALLEEFGGRGVELTQPLTLKKGYGNLEFIVQAPEGYTLAFGQEVIEDAFYDFEPTKEYGDTKLLRVSPVLATTDLQRDLAWYDSIGFKTVFLDRSSDPVGYAVVGQQGIYLHLQFQYPKGCYLYRYKI